jgi:hypothetical protein
VYAFYFGSRRNNQRDRGLVKENEMKEYSNLPVEFHGARGNINFNLE